MCFATVPWADVVAVAFAFAVGAILGSFLNVIAHRVPAGESVVWGGSRCPHCRAPVRPVDNVPIIAWCLLGGKCRDCRGPISPRYPAIETACGLGVAAVAAADLAAGSGIDRILGGQGWTTIALIAVHAGLLVTLVAWGLLAGAGHPVGGRTFLAAVLLAICSVWFVSWHGDAGLHATAGGSGWPEWILRFSARSPVAARLLGTALAWVAGHRFGAPGTGASLALATATCGWESLPILTVVTLVAQWAGGRWATTDSRTEPSAIAVVLQAVSVPLAVVAAVAAGIRAG